MLDILVQTRQNQQARFWRGKQVLRKLDGTVRTQVILPLL
ncbi:hypothetical protein RISK_004022 [Rhodopirellula islandica]|uniref:Uncharacterized protein n=1 Tax=Rhodopirellula islandica TaxID=595434 RepID=A0A0J1BBY1_RHOIS|nr:hypothetical protein RISK_004022 [Rhodopirellula islandica]